MIFKTEILYSMYLDGVSVGNFSDVNYAYWNSAGNKDNDFLN